MIIINLQINYLNHICKFKGFWGGEEGMVLHFLSPLFCVFVSLYVQVTHFSQAPHLLIRLERSGNWDSRNHSQIALKECLAILLEFGLLWRQQLLDEGWRICFHTSTKSIRSSCLQILECNLGGRVIFYQYTCLEWTDSFGLISSELKIQLRFKCFLLLSISEKGAEIETEGKTSSEKIESKMEQGGKKCRETGIRGRKEKREK